MLIDSHCHLDFPDFENERDQLIDRATQSGVDLMVTICTKVKKYDSIRAITQKYDNVYCSVGTHPHYADQETEITSTDLAKLAENEKTVAIGEAGLDFFRNNSPREDQEKGFRTHINAARETKLPLVIHARNADEVMIDILDDEMNKGEFKAILHCFSSGRKLAIRGIELGLYVSFSGILTFNKSDELRAIAKELPSDRLLVETDAPYLAPAPYRGTRNEPAYVVETAKILAETRNESYETIAKQTTENFFRLFTKIPNNTSKSDKHAA